MTVTGWTQIVALVGGYMAMVYSGEHVGLTAIVGPVERAAYRVLGVDPQQEQDWREMAGITVDAANRHPYVRDLPHRLRGDLRRAHLPDHPRHGSVRAGAQLPPAGMTPVTRRRGPT
jgi:Potassium-transporting ATPase A subunit